VNSIKGLLGASPLKKHRKSHKSHKPLHVDNETDIPVFVKMTQNGNDSAIVITAKWCGHCQRYLPNEWNQLEQMPDRQLNMAAVDETVYKKIPAIKDAKIKGYPSVVLLKTDGTLKTFDDQGESTNAIPEMRNMDFMKELLRGPKAVEPVEGYEYNTTARKDAKRPSPQAGVLMTGGFLAESIVGTFMGALQQAAPALLLSAGYSTLPTSSYISPKRQSRRASTRRLRRRA